MNMSTKTNIPKTHRELTDYIDNLLQDGEIYDHHIPGTLLYNAVSMLPIVKLSECDNSRKWKTGDLMLNGEGLLYRVL